MSFDWNDYLQLAQTLYGQGNDAARRSAVSRAYYYAFHAASTALDTNKIVTNPKFTRDRHFRVWNIYIVSANKDCRRIGNKGQRLKLARQSADYDPEEGFPDPVVQSCITEATIITAGIAVNVPESFVVANQPGIFTRAVRFVQDLF